MWIYLNEFFPDGVYLFENNYRWGVPSKKRVDGGYTFETRFRWGIPAKAATNSLGGAFSKILSDGGYPSKVFSDEGYLYKTFSK